MRKVLFTLLAALLLLIPSLGYAAESIVEGTWDRPCGTLHFIDITVTADSDASFDTQVTTDPVCGFLYAIETDPGATGPTDNSDLDLYHTVAGSATTEMLGAQGDDIIDNATNNYVTLSSEIAVCGPIGIDMQNNAVNNATFRLRLYFRIPGTE